MSPATPDNPVAEAFWQSPLPKGTPRYYSLMDATAELKGDVNKVQKLLDQIKGNYTLHSSDIVSREK